MVVVVWETFNYYYKFIESNLSEHLFNVQVLAYGLAPDKWTSVWLEIVEISTKLLLKLFVYRRR